MIRNLIDKGLSISEVSRQLGIYRQRSDDPQVRTQQGESCVSWSSRCGEDTSFRSNWNACPPVGHICVLCVSGEACPGLTERIHEGRPERIAPEICQISPEDHR